MHPKKDNKLVNGFVRLAPSLILFFEFIGKCEKFAGECEGEKLGNEAGVSEFFSFALPYKFFAFPYEFEEKK